MLETIGPPYSYEFVNLFMPMVENDEITGSMRADGENDNVSEFIGNIYSMKSLKCWTPKRMLIFEVNLINIILQ